jgi:hypothetical protein
MRQNPTTNCVEDDRHPALPSGEKAWWANYGRYGDRPNTRSSIYLLNTSQIGMDYAAGQTL